MGIRNLGLSLLSMLALAAFAPAQGTISLPGGPLPPGQYIDVTYTNPARAGEVVLMKIDNGEGEVNILEFQLDENGQGSEDWRVPSNWMAANFVTDDAYASRMVKPSPQDGVLFDSSTSDL